MPLPCMVVEALGHAVTTVIPWLVRHHHKGLTEIKCKGMDMKGWVYSMGVCVGVWMIIREQRKVCALW